MIQTPSPRQITYATSLKADLTERLSWTIDRDDLIASFDPGLDAVAELMAQVRAARQEGRRDEARALNAEAKARRQQIATEAADRYLARRRELAAADVDSMDADQISAYIDQAKAAL